MAFVRTVEAGSFTAAARDLKTTPSVVSKAVAKTGKAHRCKTVPEIHARFATHVGRTGVFGSRRPIFEREIDASAEALQPGAEPMGRLRISIPSEIARFLMTPLMARFAKDYPHLQLDVGITDRYV